MRWSPSQDYNEAVQHPASAFADPDLAAGAAAVNALDLPAPCSGNFAGVYRLDGPAGRWAVKCFTRPAAGRAQRYAAVARHLAAHPLPFLVGFRFLGQGIRVAGRWYPAVKMGWVEGPTLAAFVEAHLDRPDALLALAGLWRRLVGRLAAAGVAHGDLQHGNVL